MSGLKDRVVVITGASNGIGAATAEAFAAAGSRLVLHGRNEKKLQAVVDKCVALGIKRDNVAPVLGDLKDDKTVNDVVRTTMDRFATIHVLYNNAGCMSEKEGPIHMDGSVEGLDDMYRMNMRVPYMLTQAFIPELARTKGVVVNCSSMLSHTVNPYMTAYSCTKAGLSHMTRIMAISLAMKGVRVNAVSPGYIRTDITKSHYEGSSYTEFYDSMAKICPLEQKLATAEDVANVIVFLASDKSASITGEIVNCEKASSLAIKNVDFTDFA